MNKELVNLLVDLLERWDAETFVLRSALREAHGKRTKEEVDTMVLRAINDPDLRERYRETIWQPLRARLLLDDDAEKALSTCVTKQTKDMRYSEAEP